MKKKTTTKLKRELDAVFSKYIRQRDNGQCYTCPKKDDPKYMQCGHFVPRQYLAVRYSEINCHCQCYACNMLYNGQPSRFAMNLVRDFGYNAVDELEKARQTTTKYFPYEAKIEEYKKKLEDLSK